MKIGMAMASIWLAGLCCLYAADVAQTNSVTVALKLQDGSIVVGIPEKTNVVMNTEFGSMSVPIAALTEIQHEPDSTNTLLRFRNSDQMTGSWKEEAFALKTLFGVQKIPLRLVKSVSVRSAMAKTEGMLLYYSFDNDEGGVVRDSSGKENNGNVSGARYTAEGKNGGAYQVGRRIGYVQAPNHEAWSFGMKPFSICLWLRLSSAPGGEQMIVAHDDGGGERNKWAFELLSGNIDFHVNNESSQSYRIASHPWAPEVGKWYHLAVTRNGETYKIYVDGACVSTDQNNLPVPAANALLTIGQGEGLSVEGTIDEVMIFNRALSDDEIKQISGATK